MKTLYESILGTNNAGKGSAVLDKFIDYLKDIKTKDGYLRCAVDDIYVPADNHKRRRTCLFFQLLKSKQVTRHKQLIRLLEKCGYKQTTEDIRGYSQSPLFKPGEFTLKDVKDNTWYNVLDFHDEIDMTITSIIFKVNKDIVVVSKEKSKRNYIVNMYVYFVKDDLSTDEDLTERLKSEL